MTALRLLLTAFAFVALVTPASAQTIEGPRGPVEGPRGGGSFRGGGFGLPIIIPPAVAPPPVIEQSGNEPPRHRYPRPRKKIARRHLAPEPAVARPHPRMASAVLNLPSAGETRFLRHEILVVFRAGTSAARIAAMARRQKLELMQLRELTLIGMRVHRFSFAGNRPVADVLAAVAREPQVVSVEPHYVYALQDDAARTAPQPKSLSYSGRLLHLSEAHRLATGRGVRVAVIDSQIDFGHPEIEGSVAARFDALGDAEGQPNRHGTGMASAIVGHRQIDGAAPAAQILAARVFDGDGGQAAGLDVLAGIDWAAAQKAQVINMSFTGPSDPLLTRMLAAAAKRRIALIAAAGNDGPQSAPEYPAADPNVVAVSAIDSKDQIYDRANRASYVALAAPGVDVLVAAPRGAYDLSTGTSVACAEVSGVAALLLERRPDLDGPALRRILQKSAHALAGETGIGAGTADAEAAVDLLK